MRNGVEIRPNGVRIETFYNADKTYKGYKVIDGTKNPTPWDYLCNARHYADSMVIENGVKTFAWHRTMCQL